VSLARPAQRFEPTWESLRTHEVPEWYHDAKLGAIIHWTPSSVPAWAPIEGDLVSLARERGFDYYFAHNPYTEWYQNTIAIEGSPSALHHAQTYGAATPYTEFAPMFEAAMASWDPDAWASTLEAAGLRYVVFVTKHHDGYTLWPSRTPNPRLPGYHAPRDVVGELAAALRRRGIRMGLYYSGGLDWSLKHEVIRDIPSLFRCVGQGREYAAYVDAHWRELIEHYRPDILWGDIGYPAAGELERIFADYYNAVPEGLINDRFAQVLPDSMDPTEMVRQPTNEHYDFVTPEYSSFASATDYKWESTRGIGLGYGYNRTEGPETHASATELVRMVADVVSKNGNLLLGVGPMADGTIPAAQAGPLKGLGEWLKTNGQAIYGTRPWIVSESTTEDGIEVRFTRSAEAVYAILLGDPAGRSIVIPRLLLGDDATVAVVGQPGQIEWARLPAGTLLRFEGVPVGAPARALRISPAPVWRSHGS